ncbi:MAG: hypothetical protein U0359_18655 [Byssovorax sp.]
MKKHFGWLFAWIWALMLVGVPAAAQNSAQDGPTIKLVLNEELYVVATLENVDGFELCFVDGRYEPLPAHTKSMELGRLRLGTEVPANVRERAVIALLEGTANAVCWKPPPNKDNSAPWVEPANVNVKRVTLDNIKTKVLSSPVAALSPGLDWVVPSVA